MAALYSLIVVGRSIGSPIPPEGFKRESRSEDQFVDATSTTIELSFSLVLKVSFSVVQVGCITSGGSCTLIVSAVLLRS